MIAKAIHVNSPELFDEDSCRLTFDHKLWPERR
jgi:hypothetical protein